MILESGNLTLVNMINSQVSARSEIAGIWHEIQELRMNFSSFCCVHTRREANLAAHCCAKEALVGRKMCTWVNCIPEFIMDIVTSDLVIVILLLVNKALVICSKKNHSLHEKNAPEKPQCNNICKLQFSLWNVL